MRPFLSDRRIVKLPDFAISPPVHTTQHLLRSTQQAAAFLYQSEVVPRIETLQLRRMLREARSEGEARLAVRALKTWLRKRNLLPDAE